MGKFVGLIIAGLTIAVGIVTGNGYLIAAGISAFISASVNLLFGPKVPKPEAAESQVRSPTAPRVYGYGKRRVKGNLVFWGNNSAGATIDVISFVDGRAAGVVAVYLNDEVVNISGGNTVLPIGKKYAGGVVKCGWTLGPTPNVAFAAVTAALGAGVWPATSRGDGVVTGYVIKSPVKDKVFLDTYPQGDNVEMSLVLSLQWCFDPRDGSQSIDNPATWTPGSENPVLQLLHYFVVRRGYDYATKIAPLVDLWIAAANVCDELISGEKRYRAWVLYDSTAKPAEVIGSLLETFDGWYAENEAGQIGVYAGAWYEPTVTLGPGEIVEYDHKAYVEAENVINELIVHYISNAHDYNEVEAQAWRDEDDIEDRGFVNSQGFSPQVPSYKQARRLAKALTMRNNASDRGVLVTNYSGRVAEMQRFINVNIVEAGATIYSGPVEVERVTRNLESSGLQIEYRKVEPAAWDWNPETEDGYGASTGTFPTVGTPDPPTIDSVDYTFDSGAKTASLTVMGTGPNRDDLTWYARVRGVDDVSWSERRFDDVAPGAAVELLVTPIPVDTDVEVEIEYSTGNGRFSGWSDPFIARADTEATAPDTVGAVVLESWGASITLRTDPIPRARRYAWLLLADDGVTPITQRFTSEPRFTYTSGMSAYDGGVRRSYKVEVQGQNNAGNGPSSLQLAIAKPAPAAPTAVNAADGAYSALVTFTPSVDPVTGYILYFGSITGFDPLTEGRSVSFGEVSSYVLENLAAGTYYYRVGALDGWTTNPSLLNLSAEDSFTITAGGGGVSGTGGGGGWNGGGLKDRSELTEF